MQSAATLRFLLQCFSIVAATSAFTSTLCETRHRIGGTDFDNAPKTVVAVPFHNVPKHSPESYVHSTSTTQRAAVPAASTAMAAFLTFTKSSPFITAFLSCAVNGAAADWIAQSTEAVLKSKQVAGAATSAVSSAAPIIGSNSTDAVAVSIIPPSNRPAARSSASATSMPISWDPKRSLAFTLYGGCYQGVACHVFYNILFTKWFGPSQVITKVAVSQLIMAPLLTLPCAYVFKGLVFGKTIRQTLEDYWVGVTQKGLLFSFWKLWVPVQFLLFAVIPPHLRIPLSSIFSFCWTVILSRKTMTNHS